MNPHNQKNEKSNYLAREVKGRDFTAPVLEREGIEGQIWEKPKLSIQKAPTRGNRR